MSTFTEIVWKYATDSFKNIRPYLQWFIIHELNWTNGHIEMHSIIISRKKKKMKTFKPKIAQKNNKNQRGIYNFIPNIWCTRKL